MADVVFEDYSIKCKDAISGSLEGVLAECAGELVAQTQRNSRVATGRTKGSFEYKVDGAANTAYIGSNYENAIWEEFGTGEYALEGNGRAGGWRYQDAKGEWHFTRGKKPSRAFWNAFNSTKNAIINRIENALKGL